jgi:hypothetical protein
VAGGKTVAAEQGAWLCFEDEAGQTLRPPKVRRWGRRGQTPTVAVSGKGSGPVSIAGLVCVRPGHRSRLIYRTLTTVAVRVSGAASLRPAMRLCWTPRISSWVVRSWCSGTT